MVLASGPAPPHARLGISRLHAPMTSGRLQPLPHTTDEERAELRSAGVSYRSFGDPPPTRGSRPTTTGSGLPPLRALGATGGRLSPPLDEGGDLPLSRVPAQYHVLDEVSGALLFPAEVPNGDADVVHVANALGGMLTEWGQRLDESKPAFPLGSTLWGVLQMIVYDIWCVVVVAVVVSRPSLLPPSPPSHVPRSLLLPPPHALLPKLGRCTSPSERAASGNCLVVVRPST